MKVTIYSVGDWDVGIPSCESYVEIPFDNFKDITEKEDVRKILYNCFHELHDNGRTIVTFEDEEQ